jgi:hypothetical protein
LRANDRCAVRHAVAIGAPNWLLREASTRSVAIMQTVHFAYNSISF